MFQTLLRFFFFFFFFVLPGDYLRALRVLIENSFSFGKEKYVWKVMIKSEPGFLWQHWFIHNTRDGYITCCQQLIMQLSTQSFLGRPDDISRDFWFWKKNICCWVIRTSDFFVLMHAIYKEKNSRILIMLKLRNSTNQILF